MITRTYHCKSCCFISKRKFKCLSDVEVEIKCDACGKYTRVKIESVVSIFRGEGFTRHMS